MEAFFVDRSGASDGEVEEGIEYERKNATSYYSPSGDAVDAALDLSKILTLKASPNDSTSLNTSTAPISCFNCGGHHTIGSCSMKKDSRRIAINRANHYNSKKYLQERYIDEVKVPKYEPGKLSSRLLNVLGIAKNDIPEWIYRMRRMGLIDGYPPGYLKKAIETANQSNDDVLSFFDEHESEKNGSVRRKPPGILESQIIFYPGFNKFVRGLNDRDRQRFVIPKPLDYTQYLQEFIRKEFYQNERNTSNLQKRKSDLVKFRQKRIKFDSSIDAMEERTDCSGGDLSVNVGLRSSSTQNSTSPESSCSSKSYSVDVRECSSESVILDKVENGIIQLDDGAPHILMFKAKKPSLEKFSVGILPFETREECSTNQGFFDKFIKKIRKEM